MNADAGARPGLALALTGALLLGFATPPAIVPFGEWLWLPALAIWFGVASEGRRPLWHSYLYGCLHMAWFSWSVRHVLLPAYVAIVFVGGLYYLLATACVRGTPKALRPVGFAVAVAGAFWLRAAMPEIWYPHGQPCHALYEWPALMRVVTLGGEPLMNALLALCGAAAWLLWSSWRVAVPTWRRAGIWCACAWLLLFGAAALGSAVSLLATTAAPAGERTVRVAAIEPGVHPFDLWALAPRARRELFVRRFVEPTRRALAAQPSPDLVLWPESSVDDRPDLASLEAGDVAMLRGVLPASDARLLVGANVRVGDELTPAAMMVELPGGRVLGHHEKQRLVPGGEFVPLVGMLPSGLAASLRELFQQALGAPPDCRVGQPRPPLRTAAGQPFGALLCYDNAFPGPAADQVAQGATLLVVLSNEAWYRGGAELEQLVAMTVVRACENVTPIVRCTMDGRSVAVSAAGRIVAGLALDPAPRDAARILSVSLEGGSGKLPPMAWLRRNTGFWCAVLLALGAAHAAVGRVRLRSARTASAAGAPSGPSGDRPGGS
ncbi:MAG: apolipoprotein N-acyltransferase [Planctomycetes bacterium]|nr:apolipoprotein N-acyltransferase [Planctomycetota bacterium]